VGGENPKRASRGNGEELLILGEGKGDDVALEEDPLEPLAIEAVEEEVGAGGGGAGEEEGGVEGDGEAGGGGGEAEGAEEGGGGGRGPQRGDDARPVPRPCHHHVVLRTRPQ